MTKPLNGYRIGVLLLALAELASCDKNAVQDLPFEPLLGARIKFFNFGVNAPGVNFYADATKMTAIQSGTGSEATTGVAYGGAGNGGAYSQIAPGAHTLTGRIAAAIDKDTVVARVNATLDAGKVYSFYTSGFYNTTTKNVDAFVVEDAYPAQINWSVAEVRFVHTIANANPLTLYAANTTTNDTVAIGGVVSYQGGGAFTAVPPGVYNLFARYADSTTNKIVRTGVSLAAGRVYTVGARGDITITSTTATNRPFLDNTTNR
ncbi:MAG TPA: DUF4397 domain-containing protein [Gemmatimonadales bacterium]|jgi:hypothetical protein|nr:DUF4397 domain-containing protein [Gemmatimonadales bacterium]